MGTDRTKPSPRYHFKPWNVGRWVLWGAVRAGAAGWRRWSGPRSFALTMLSQMGIAIIACLAYNMLLGQGGMLSFGHAVYTGLGVVPGHPHAEPGGRGQAARCR